MSPTENPPSPPSLPTAVVQCICPKCQAVMKPTDKRCWLCYAENRSNNAFGESVPTIAQTRTNATTTAANRSRWDALAWGILGLCAVMAVLVAIGIAVDSPGALIPYAIVLLPAMIVTLTRGFVERGPEGEWQPRKMLLTLAISWLVTMGAMVLLTIGAVVLLFLMCLSQGVR